ncbi:hypothetical protein CRI77_22405 [Mycolicibacterium duvalii]|uniref:Uncharacterized protein n=1 Tax=Mycolicibacterium duvalii TaxID=39688 RepID=A0A7I7JTV4_9MYCO|nr:hypothetical protein [Mycolicibacterium duvalii]MCV7368526.1 hypothetical protein [Mycolicibacterium duvalii]PEG36736.1 hypothetical protein CRI77_22405 [Mycolicibacterium duvalii]BBX15220.1 hypothetical protein MDUV_00800 [Mycolicibacterium duvalii]
MDLANVIISGISAAVAVGSAIVAGVSALRSREAKRIAEEKRDEAVQAAKDVASDVGRIATVQESRQRAEEARNTAEQSAQASSVLIVLSEVQRGFSGWKVHNESSQPVTNVVVSGVAGAQIVVYLGSGPEPRSEYVEPTVGAYKQSRLMFRPTGTDAVHADASEIERMALRFTDARQQTWEKIGSQPVRPVVS